MMVHACNLKKYVYSCLFCMYFWYLQRSEERVGSIGPRVTDSYGPPYDS